MSVLLAVGLILPGVALSICAKEIFARLYAAVFGRLASSGPKIMLNDEPVNSLLYIILALTVGPILEEIMFRGPILFVAQRFGAASIFTIGALVFLALLFGVLHIGEIDRQFTITEQTKRARRLVAVAMVTAVAGSGLIRGSLALLYYSLSPLVFAARTGPFIIFFWCLAPAMLAHFIANARTLVFRIRVRKEEELNERPS